MSLLALPPCHTASLDNPQENTIPDRVAEWRSRSVLGRKVFDISEL